MRAGREGERGREGDVTSVWYLLGRARSSSRAHLIDGPEAPVCETHSMYLSASYLSASWAAHIEFMFAALELRGAEVLGIEHERELSPARVLPPDLGTQGPNKFTRTL